MDNIRNSFQEKGTVIANDYDTRTLRRCDVELSFQLPGDGTVNYWLATTRSKEEEMKLIAKTVSGMAAVIIQRYNCLNKNIRWL